MRELNNVEVSVIAGGFMVPNPNVGIDTSIVLLPGTILDPMPQPIDPIDEPLDPLPSVPMDPTGGFHPDPVECPYYDTTM